MRTVPLSSIYEVTMSETKKPSIQFASLHGHTTFSVSDGLDYPEEHIEFASGNGLTGIAFTEHGNMNSLSYAYAKAKKLKEAGSDFRVMYGIEAYVHPNIDEWRQERVKIKEAADAKKDETEEENGLVVEDEQETKKGIRSTLNKRSHLVLVAQNQKGLNNLFKLVSNSYSGDNFYRFPRIDYSMLKENNEGIIASSACLGGILSNDYWDNIEKGRDAVYRAMEKTVETMMDIFGDRFYGELQWANYAEQHIVNQFIIELSKQYGFKLISTCDSHFPSPDKWKDREIYKMLGWMGKRKDEIKIDALPQTLEEMEYQLYPKNGDELYESYRTFSKRLGFSYDDNLILESIERTADIAKNRIEHFLPENNVKLPSFVVPEGESADSALVKMSIELLKKRGLHTEKVYVDRLKEELHTIKDRGFSKYFLTMKIISDKSRSMNLCGGGRGSGAGSLVSYLLNITEVDPIKYKLQFSRFIRKTAKDWPDIDFDTSNAMAVKDAMIEEYGANRVVPISNYNTLQIRSLVKDISKLYEIPFQEVNEVTSNMLDEAIPECKKIHGITAGVYNPTWQELKEHSYSLQQYLKKYPNVATHVETLQGQIRSISRHAGGVLFADNLNENMPLIKSGGVTQTPWTEGQTVRHLEPLGFIKFDVLGLKTLLVIEDTIRHILKRAGNANPTFQDIKAWYDEHIHAEKIDLGDQQVYENIFHKGRFVGTFQFTGRGAQNFCMDARPTNITDLSAITSIYRPGPMTANVDKKYVDAKNDPSSVHYVHPLFKEVTEETYGYLVFQEQISLLAHKLGKDISLDEGNELRKVLTKKGTGKEAEVKNKLYKKFIDGCVEKGLGEEKADELWKTMEFFSGYGFNLSHATCYSIISFQCAWLWYYYPVEWLAAFLTHEPEDRKQDAISLAKRYGYKVKGIDINRSTAQWEVADDKTLVQPLSSVKGIGDAAVAEIVRCRPFKTIEDLLFREGMAHNKVNKRVLDALCRVGGLDDLVDSRFTGLKHFWSAIVVDRPKTPKKLMENIEKYKPEGDFTPDEKLEFLITLTGTFPITTILSDKIVEKLEEKNILPISQLEEKQGLVWLVPRKIEEKSTKNGRIFWIVSVTDSSGSLTEVKFWGVNRKKDILYQNKPYLCKVEKDKWGFSVRSFENVRMLG